MKLWLPSTESPPSDLDLETSRFILKQVGDHFCDLLVQEREALNEHMSDGEFSQLYDALKIFRIIINILGIIIVI